MSEPFATEVSTSAPHVEIENATADFAITKMHVIGDAWIGSATLVSIEINGKPHSREWLVDLVGEKNVELIERDAATEYDNQEWGRQYDAARIAAE